MAVHTNASAANRPGPANAHTHRNASGTISARVSGEGRQRGGLRSEGKGKMRTDAPTEAKDRVTGERRAVVEGAPLGQEPLGLEGTDVGVRVFVLPDGPVYDALSYTVQTRDG